MQCSRSKNNLEILVQHHLRFIVIYINLHVPFQGIFSQCSHKVIKFYSFIIYSHHYPCGSKDKFKYSPTYFLSFFNMGSFFLLLFMFVGCRSMGLIIFLMLMALTFFCSNPHEYSLISQVMSIYFFLFLVP